MGRIFSSLMGDIVSLGEGLGEEARCDFRCCKRSFLSIYNMGSSLLPNGKSGASMTKSKSEEKTSEGKSSSCGDNMGLEALDPGRDRVCTGVKQPDEELLEPLPSSSVL